MALLPTDPAKQKQILFGLLPLVMAFAFYQLVYTKQVAEIEEVETHVETLTAKNAAAQAVVAQYGTDLPRQLAMFQENIRQLEVLIPRREDVPMLINMITEQAQRLGVELTALNPSVEQAGEHYSRQSYELYVLGDYHSIAEYVTSIGSLPRIVRAGDMRLAVQDVDRGPDGTPLLRAIFRINTFIMPTAAAAAEQ
jgi:type IV pilus assembly protein PilO